MKVWVTRDKSKENGMCGIWAKNNPVFEKGYYNYQKRASMIVCEEAEDFKRIFHFTPRKGSCEQMELTLTRIE